MLPVYCGRVRCLFPQWEDRRAARLGRKKRLGKGRPSWFKLMRPGASSINDHSYSTFPWWRHQTLEGLLANLVIVICIRFPKSTFVWDSHPEGTVVAQPSLSTHSTSLLRVSKAPRSASYGSFSPMVHLIGSPSKQQSGFSPLFLPKSVLCSFKRLEVSNTTIHSTWSDLLNIPRILIHINSASWDTVLSVYAMLHLLLDQQPKVKQKRRKLRFQILQPQFSKVSPPPKVKTWS